MKPAATIRHDFLYLSTPILLGGFLGVALYVSASLPLKWLLAATSLLLLTCLFAIFGRVRLLLLVLLPLSIPITFNVHLTYRPEHIGVSGITIEAIDSWLFMLLALWLYEARIRRRGNIRFFDGTTWPFIFIFLCGLVSLFNSSYPDLSVYGLVDSLRCFLLYICLANNTLEAKERRLVLLGLQGTVLLLGLVNIMEAVLQVNFVTSAYELSEMTEWDTVFRSAGLATPTLTAGYLASMLPILCAQMFTPVRRIHRFSLMFTLLLGGIGLLLTLTRGAFLSLAIGALPLLIHLLYKKRLKLVYILLPIGAFIAIAVGYEGNIKIRMDEGSDNAVARYALVQMASNAIWENPVLGMGLNTYHQEMDKYAANSGAHNFEYVVHNKFLLIWSEIGPFALLSFLALIFICFRKMVIVCRSGDAEAGIMAAGLLTSLIVTSIHMNFESYDGGFLMQMFSTQIALIASLSLQNKLSEEIPAGKSSHQEGRP